MICAVAASRDVVSCLNGALSNLSPTSGVLETLLLLGDRGRY